MAARLDPAHDERTRAKIQTSQLINRLILHVNGEVELSTTQVRAAEILLKKTLPDLSSVEVGSDPEKPMKMTFEWLMPQSG
jgi:hypothetical protein